MLGAGLGAACDDDGSGASYPAADLVRFDGATLPEGVVDPRDGQVVVQGPAEAGHDWALAVADGAVLVGVPALGELRRYALDGADPAAGEALATGSPTARFGAAVDWRESVWVVGAPDTDAGPDAAQAGALLHGGAQAGTLTGEEAQGRLGSSVAACGDLDGDGTAELAAAAPWADELAGRVLLSAVGSSPRDTSTVRTLGGARPNERFGAAVLCGADLLGDTAADLVVGAPFGVGAAGLDGEGYVGVWDGPALAAGAAAATLTSGAGDREAFGSALASCRLRSNGHPDLVVGAPLGRAGLGAAYVYLGLTGLGELAVPALTLVGDAPDGRFGSTLRCADVDGDGLDELFVGAPGVDAEDGTNEAGAVYVYSGLGTLSGERGPEAARTVFTADRAFLRAGRTLAAGDLDGDGRAEVILLVRQRAQRSE